MVFSNRMTRTAEITQFLTENKFHAKELNSNFKQDERFNTLNLFKDGKIHILVTTDVAARGIQIQDVDAVINYDAPPKAEFYIHRIGRTGRRDKKGYCLSLICPEDEDRFNDIEFDFQLQVSEIDLEFKRKN